MQTESGYKGCQNDEEWKPVIMPDLGNVYEASSLGRIRRKKTLHKTRNRFGEMVRSYPAKILTPIVQPKTGYLMVGISVNNKKMGILAHRMVCYAFHGEPKDGQEVGHLNGIRSDNRPENLAWVTKKENQFHRKAHGTHIQGEKVSWSKLTEDAVREIRAAHKNGEVMTKYARKFGVSYPTVEKVYSDKTWRHVK